MSKVRDQIAALTRHLYEQHQAEKAPYDEQVKLLVHVLGKTVAEEIVIQALPPVVGHSRPLAPGVHPTMGQRFIPGAVEIRQSVHSRGAAMDVIDRVFKTEHVGTWPDSEDDTPSVEVAPTKKKFSRKLEP